MKLPRSALENVRKVAYGWLIIQVIVTVIISLLLFLIHGIHTALSALLGGLICVLPNLMFACILFWRSSFNPKSTIKALYIGELIKLSLTGLLFILVIKLLSVNIIGLFLGFIGAQFGFWIAPFIKLRV